MASAGRCWCSRMLKMSILTMPRVVVMWAEIRLADVAGGVLWMGVVAMVSLSPTLSPMVVRARICQRLSCRRHRW